MFLVALLRHDHHDSLEMVARSPWAASAGHRLSRQWGIRLVGASHVGVIQALDQLEANALALRIQVWHLIVWRMSPVRPLAARFNEVYPAALNLIEACRQTRATHIASARTMADYQVLPARLSILADQETALSSRIERVRFLITSKEGEEHAKRSVMLGVLGAILGGLSLI